MTDHKVLLAIDTATDVCSVAISTDGQVESESRTGARTEARMLPSMVDALLSRVKLNAAQIDGFVFGAGPGSFTGLRIGIALVQGLALGCGAPVAGISSLRAQAQAAMDNNPQSYRVLVANNAYMGEIYVGRYRRSEGIALADAPDALIVPQNVKSGDADLLIGDGVSLCPELANSTLPRSMESMVSAEALLKIAKQDRSVEWGAAQEARAQYLRPDEAIAHKPRTET
ncbi:MAG: tRNA (adenosine(37)-N6)-threonylcarbamoyltransferase complex dimerization subunit type 1 TsaB [Pseudomonadota bacterium]